MGERSQLTEFFTHVPGFRALAGQVTLGASGAIAASDDGSVHRGFAIAKTAGEVGRYTVTLDAPAKQVVGVFATPIIADDAAYSNTAGFHASLRDDDVASDKTFELQFHRNSDMADAEITDNFSFMLLIVLRTRSY